MRLKLGFFSDANVLNYKPHVDPKVRVRLKLGVLRYASNKSHYTKNKLKCCEFKGKQASRIESTSLCCRNYSVLHVRDQKNEWSVFVE